MALQPISPSPFSQCNTPITRVGLGGEGILRTQGMGPDAQAVIARAVDLGIGYYDSARVYQDSEVYYGEFWAKQPRAREGIFHTSKSAQRSREGALAELQQSLARLNTDYLDLWQIHDVRDERDLAVIGGRGGALEAFVEAKAMGLVRYIGVTGHHDPEILTRAVADWPVDSVLMPVNPAEKILGGFLTHTLAAARQKGIVVIGMKVLGGKHYVQPDQGMTAETLIRFALAQDVDLVIVGCRTPAEVETLVAVGEADTPLSDREMEAVVAAFEPHARQLAFYRGSRFQIP